MGLLLICSPRPERKATLIAHSALGGMAELDERATVGVAELIREEVRRESALDRRHGAAWRSF